MKAAFESHPARSPEPDPRKKGPLSFYATLGILKADVYTGFCRTGQHKIPDRKYQASLYRLARLRAHLAPPLTAMWVRNSVAMPMATATALA